MGDPEDKALRRVINGRKLIAEQKLRIERFRAKGRDTAAAEQLLAEYERSQAIFENDLKKLIE